MPVKVLHVIDHLGFGGEQLPIPLNIAEHINRDKFETFICALRPNPKTRDVRSGVITLPYGKWDPRALLVLVKLCKEHHIDILHAHLPKSIIGCILASYFCKIPVIVHEHGGGIFQEGVTLYGLFIKRFHHRAAAIIAVSQATARELVQRAAIKKEKIEVIYSAIDFGAFEISKVSQSQARKKLGISEKDVVLGFVGRLHAMKGIDLLIEALALLLQKSSNYLLLLAGDGAEQKSLESLAKRLGVSERVRFLGVCQNVSEVMSVFDVGVMPSRHEPFGRVAVELMRMKVPVVSSGLAGLAELVKDGQTGVVTRENSPEEICRSIELLLANDELRKRIVEEAYIFSEQFGIKEHVKKLEELYMAVHR